MAISSANEIVFQCVKMCYNDSMNKTDSSLSPPHKQEMSFLIVYSWLFDLLLRMVYVQGFGL